MKNIFARRENHPFLLGALTLLLSWLLTFALWNTAQHSAARNLRTEFDSRVSERTDGIVQRVGAYEQILRGVRGFLRNSIAVSRDEYRNYVNALNLNEYFPGIQGIGISEIIRAEDKDAHIASLRREGFPGYNVWPAGNRAIYTSITKIEPFNRMNQRAFGYDMFSDPVRRAAMEAARDSGKAALSGKVTLVQEDGDNPQPGFLMYLPVYAVGLPAETTAQRRALIRGWIYAPFRIRDFMRGIGGLSARDLDVTIFDGGLPSAPACLLGCDGKDENDALLRATKRILIAGRPWLIEIRSTPSFEARMNSDTPRLILGGGIVIGLLLAFVVWILATGRNRAMTLARQMTQELRASHGRIQAEQRRMQSILETSHDAFVAIDRECVVTDWNAAARRLFGWKAGDAIGRKLASLIFPSEPEALRQAGFSRDTAAPGKRTARPRVEVNARHCDGHVIPVEVTVATMDDESGHTVHAFIRDLSEQKEAQRREARHQRALEEARTALQHAQRLEAVGKLTGGVAHDFNNVLQIISGNIQLMLHQSAGDPHLEARLEAAMQAVDRGAKLSSQLLSFARRQPLQPKVVDLRRLLREMQELIRRAVGEEIAIKTVMADDLRNTMVDPGRLENVILNLAINARDAMSGRGKLRIELANATLDARAVSAFADVRPGRYVMLAISDTGTGMPPEVIERAFEPFFTTKPAGEGTGLGLSMTYGFVKQSEGHIRIDSTPGQGTTISIYLPQSTAAEENLPEPAVSQPSGGSETVLVVEDDVNVQSTVATMLTDLGYRVLKANDGDRAMKIVRAAKSIDLLFTDVVMPGEVSSTDLARETQKMHPHAAVLFTSGYTQEAIVHGGRLDPNVSLLSKPYRREELARKLRQVLDLPAAT